MGNDWLQWGSVSSFCHGEDIHELDIEMEGITVRGKQVKPQKSICNRLQNPIHIKEQNPLSEQPSPSLKLNRCMHHTGDLVNMQIMIQ